MYSRGQEISPRTRSNAGDAATTSPCAPYDLQSLTSQLAPITPMVLAHPVLAYSNYPTCSQLDPVGSELETSQALE